MKQKTVFKLKTVELKNCLETDAGIQYINRTPPYEWIFFLRGVFETPQTERLSAFVTVAEARGNVKGFFLRGACSAGGGKFAVGCPVQKEARCLDRSCPRGKRGMSCSGLPRTSRWK